MVLVFKDVLENINNNIMNRFTSYKGVVGRYNIVCFKQSIDKNTNLNYYFVVKRSNEIFFDNSMFLNGK